MNKGLRRAGIVGLSTVVAASMMTLTAATAQADWAAIGGDIGLVDTCTMAAPTTACPVVAGTQGATLVQPNVPGQALGDMRILVPNLFKAGDTIDLAIFDRTATNASAGDINADLAHRLGFTSAPTVAVNATPVILATNVGPLSSSANNTEGTGANAPTAAAAGAATTAPIFTTTLVSSSRGAGLTPKATDIIRLTIGNLSAGTDTTGTASKWIITVSGVTADLGASVSPGELRVVPFAYNGNPALVGTTASDMFAGNKPDLTEALPPQVYNPVINLYTVPAYVAPVTFNIGAPNNIVADGTIQRVGDITIAETNNYSLQTGDYTVTIGGANVVNTAAAPVTIAATGLTGTEAVTVTNAYPVVGGVVHFQVWGAVNTTKISIKISGLLLSTTTPGTITYTLAGGSINNTGNHSFLVRAGDSLEIPTGFAGTPGTGGVFGDNVFGNPNGTSTAVNQNDIVAPGFVVNAFSSDVVHRIGGSDRYETAAKIALNNGANDYIVLASGENFPDALSSGYLANQIGGGSIVLTTKNVLPAATASAMRELGTKTVFIVGGTGAISAGVEAQLKATPQYYGRGSRRGLETVGQGTLHVVRLGGLNRYATNKIVNQYAAAMFEDANPVGRTAITFGQSSKLTALVATGENFPDALAGGPATVGGGRGNLPLILTQTGLLTADASAQLNNLGIQQAVILGGTGAVSSATEASITGMGIVIDRLGGADRYATAALIADFETADANPTATTDGGLGFDSGFCSTNHRVIDCERAYLATGVVYADALAGATLAGGSGSPILLTNPTTLSTPTQVWLSDHSDTYASVVAFGLAGAVSNAVLDAANAAVAGG